MARNTTAVLQHLDRSHHVHPFTDPHEFEDGGPRVVVGGKGIYINDSEGNSLIDGAAGLWCTNIGYGRTELAEAAYAQMLNLAFYNTFFRSTTEPAIELAHLLAEISPEGLNHAFFTNSGSEANDSIVKIVRFYWNLMGKPDKKIIISRHLSYHGSTLAAASMCGLKHMHPQFDLPLPGFVHCEAPYWYKNGADLDPEEYGLRAAASLEEMIIKLGPENVGAFIGEPVMGGGGVIVPPGSYWPEVERICKKYDVLLVADEVICGFGRTGSWFGSQTFKFRPDLMSIAKGLSSGYMPIAGVMLNDKVADTLATKGGEIAHGFTYSGHTTACAVAVANINIMKREGLVEKVRDETGPYFQNKLHELEDHPLVGEVRGVGMLAGIELVEEKAERRSFDSSRKVGVLCRNNSYENGLIMRACFDSMVLSPPLVISKDEIDVVCGKIRKSLDQTLRQVEARNG